MEKRIKRYLSDRDELLVEINEARSIIHSPEPLHDDPIEDLAIRGIWSALLEPLLQQLEEMDRALDGQKAMTIPEQPSQSISSPVHWE